MARPNTLTRSSSSTYTSLLGNDKMTGTHSSHSQSSCTTTMSTPPCSRHPSSLTLAVTLGWASNHTSLHPESKRWMSSRTGWRTQAKSALAKAKDDMARYYNQCRAPAPTFAPGDKVYLDSSDIRTTRPSMKLLHHCLGPYRVERSVGHFAYHLTLPHSMRQLHPVFNVVKLTPAPPDPIVGRHQTPPPPPELIDGEEEYVVEEILDSRMFWWKLQYLVKWKVYGIENNSWRYWDNLGNAAEVVADFHVRHPGAPRHICATAFGTIPFQLISRFSPAPASGWCSSRRGGDCKGNPLTLRTPLHTEHLCLLNTHAHWTPTLTERLHSSNACTHQTPIPTGCSPDRMPMHP